MPRLRRIQQFVRVLDGFFDGLFLRSGFIDIGRSEQVTDEVAQEDEAVVKVGILAQQLLDHIRLIGDQVVHADAQQFAGILFAVDGPCGDRLAALMDLLHHTGGDKGGLYAEEICGRQIVITAHAQCKDIAGPDLRCQLLDLAEGFITLRGDGAVLRKAFFADDADGFRFQLRGGGIGLDLNVQLDLTFAQVQHFFQCGNFGTSVLLAEPAPGIQLTNLVIGQVVDVLVAAGAAAQAGIVGHHDHAVLGHLHIQLGPLAALIDGQLESGQGVFRCGSGVAAVRGDYRRNAAQHGEQLVVSGQGKVTECQRKGEQSSTRNRCTQKQPAGGTVILSALDRLRLRGERLPQAAVQHGEDRALRHGDGAVDQELEERHLNGQRRAGQCKHGLCALQPDRDDDAVQRHGNRCRQQQGTQDDREVPAQQQKKSTEDAPADAAKAFLYRLPQAFALQHEQRQHQHPADTEEQQGSTGSQIEQVIPAVCLDDTHDIFRHGKLRDIVIGEEKIGERDQHGTVDQNEPVLRQECVADICKRGAQQGRQADRFALAGKIQPMQQDGKLIQRPERGQDGNERDAQDDRGGGKDIGSIVVAQVVHGCEPQRERPELLHQGDEQQVRCSLIQDDDREQGDLGAADDSPGGVLHGVVGFVGGAE